MEPSEDPADLQHAAAGRCAGDDSLGRLAEERAALNADATLERIQHPQPVMGIAGAQMHAAAGRDVAEAESIGAFHAGREPVEGHGGAAWWRRPSRADGRIRVHVDSLLHHLTTGTVVSSTE